MYLVTSITHWVIDYELRSNGVDTRRGVQGARTNTSNSVSSRVESIVNKSRLDNRFSLLLLTARRGAARLRQASRDERRFAAFLFSLTNSNSCAATADSAN